MSELFSETKTVDAEIVQPVRVVEETATELIAFRKEGFNLSIPQMMAGMDDYFEKRRAFRTRILSELTEGIHYGYPPGIRASNADEKQWKASPSLYKRGAAEICSLFKIRAEFSADINLWQQLGAKPGTIAIKCRLLNLQGEVVGEGYGARKVGDKSMQENASVKMAEKSALVDAVLNGFGLSDLFTQDLEDLDREPHQVPDARPNPPPAQPRGKRVTIEDVNALVTRFKDRKPDASLEDWGMFVQSATGKVFKNIKAVAEWCQRDIDHVSDKIAMELET